jgi:hypothetical protein
VLDEPVDGDVHVDLVLGGDGVAAHLPAEVRVRVRVRVRVDRVAAHLPARACRRPGLRTDARGLERDRAAGVAANPNP